jgi:glyoxylase-like metal-dependent hydrolase (beta-lactamase superfamily II)
MRIETVALGDYGSNCYILAKEGSSSALVIDPGAEAGKIVEYLESVGLVPVAILITHGHYDHISAAPDIAEQFNIPVYMHQADEEGYIQQREIIESWGGRLMTGFLFFEEKKYTLAGLTFRVIHTPGHSPGAVCLDFGKDLFSGDTLFYGTIGRTDIPGGDPEELFRSLKKIAAEFPDGEVYPGHGPKTSMAAEFRRNFFLKKAAGKS